MAAHRNASTGASLRMAGLQLGGAAGSARDAVRHIKAVSDVDLPTEPEVVYHQVRAPCSPPQDKLNMRGRPSVLRNVRQLVSPCGRAGSKDSAEFSDSTVSPSSAASSMSFGSDTESDSESDSSCSHSRGVYRNDKPLAGFWTEKVEGWFRLIDTMNTGSVTKIEFRLALQKFPELQKLLCETICFIWDQNARSAYARKRASGLFALSVEEHGTVIHDERVRTSAIFENFAWNSARKLDCSEFVSFFRKNGMLLDE